MRGEGLPPPFFVGGFMSGSDFFNNGVIALEALFTGLNNLGWLTYFIYFGLFFSIVFFVFEAVTGGADD